MTTPTSPPAPLLVSLALVIGEVQDSGGDAPALLRSAVVAVGLSEEDQHLLTELMDANALLDAPRDARDVTMEAMVQSAVRSAAFAESVGMARDRIILSAKVSGVQDLIDVYRMLARRSAYPLHLGLTEAGMGAKGIVASAAAGTRLSTIAADVPRAAAPSSTCHGTASP